MQRVHYRRFQDRGQKHGGWVEGVVVNDVVGDLPNRCVHGRERTVGSTGIGCPRLAMTVEKAGKGCRVNPRVNHGDAGDGGACGSINVNLMAALLQAGGEIGHDRLRSAELRLLDPRHQGRDDGNPHHGTFL